MGRNIADYHLNPHTFMYEGRFAAFRYHLDAIHPSSRRALVAVHLKLTIDSRIESHFVAIYTDNDTGFANLEITIRFKEDVHRFYDTEYWLTLDGITYPAVFYHVNCQQWLINRLLGVIDFYNTKTYVAAIRSTTRIQLHLGDNLTSEHIDLGFRDTVCSLDEYAIGAMPSIHDAIEVMNGFNRYPVILQGVLLGHVMDGSDYECYLP